MIIPLSVIVNISRRKWKIKRWQTDTNGEWLLKINAHTHARRNASGGGQRKRAETIYIFILVFMMFYVSNAHKQVGMNASGDTPNTPNAKWK